MTQASPVAEMRSPAYVSELIEMLVGCDLRLKVSKEPFLLAKEPGLIGVYRREDETLGGVMISDLAFGAYCGCALAMISVETAEEAIKDGVLPDSIRDNFSEVVNVASRLYITPRSPRVIYKGLHNYPCELPRELLQYIAKPTERVDYSVDIEGYGPAHFAMLIQ